MVVDADWRPQSAFVPQGKVGPMKTRYRNASETGIGRKPLGGAMITLVAVLAGCGDDPPVATTLSISPESATLLELDETAAFTATIADQYGDPFDGRVTWSSSVTDVFTVDANGVVTAVANGAGMVQAVHGSLSATASVTVDAPVATAISISPESVTLETIGETATFVATITDQRGNEFSGTVTWSSEAAEVFTLDSEGTVTSVWNGSGMVRATHENLSATASVTVDAGDPPEPRSEFDDVSLSVGGGTMAVTPAAFFDDPDDDILDLTFTAHVTDSAVASTEVVTDSEGHTAVLMTGTAVGTADLTIVATDPAGLYAEQSLAMTVDDEGHTVFPGLVVFDNKIELGGVAVVGRCSPPIEDVTSIQGFLVTLHSSEWQSRSDSTADWAYVEGTRNTEGRLCPHNARVAGDYRLVLNLSLQIDEHFEPITGNYRSENSFTVLDPGDDNQAPVLNPDHFNQLTLAAGGGAIPIVAARFFTDPDGDTLTYTLVNTDSASVAAEFYVDSLGHTVGTLSGKAVGTAVVTISATDPGGLGAEWTIGVTVDDSGATPWYAVYVANGVLIAFGTQLAVCMPPTINLESVDGNTYTVHVAKWQSRSDSTEAWSDIDGTEITNGQVCPYTATEPGDYRLVYEMSILFDPDVPAIRGWYRSPNFFTVSSSSGAIRG